MPKGHIVKAYDAELNQLESMIAEMGGLVETQLANALSALVNAEQDKAKEIVKFDKRIDEFEAQIDAHATRMLALRQPMAEDLRVIIAALKISNNLERMGDYAKNIAKRTVTLTRVTQLSETSESIRRMGEIVEVMIKDVLDSFVERNKAEALEVIDKDHEVDAMYTSVFREIITYMMEDPRNITPCTHMLFIAKNVERIGDHATNVAEQIHFMLEGEFPDEDRMKDDKTSSLIVDAD